MDVESREGAFREARPVTAAPAGETLAKIQAALGCVPVFAGTRWEDVEVEPLDSFTNLSYKLTAHGSAYVLRVAGKGTSSYIDRGAEEHNARIATEAGLNAEVLFFDPDDGTMLSRFIEGPHMDRIGLHDDPEAIARAALTLRRVHGIGKAFKSRFGPYAPIDYYFELLRGLNSPLPDVFHEVKHGAEAVRQVLKAASVPAAPCHNDTCPENFVEVGGSVYLIDWEYSGMNDPMCDLGNLSVETGFDPEQDRVMMEAYCGGAVPPGLYDRVVLHKAISDYFWGLWGLVQHANGSPATDYWAYATDRFEHCKAVMGNDEFRTRLDAVRAPNETAKKPRA
ncbi:phosphotransferase [Rubrobacter tropicus]|uniref:Phosphotransferase n=1 Tax=Rubrobacter tropicus TaxID=2653851 RepID=A0A6G8QE76_9ACTN|nr:choline/ethanolamine kinase family protein [Rubrobacter tropicus]QIN84701.1 phosphotransferase [Rubrobacter tropicus]